jgi:hypothetical protein
MLPDRLDLSASGTIPIVEHDNLPNTECTPGSGQGTGIFGSGLEAVGKRSDRV